MEIKARSKTPKNHCKIALWIFCLLIWVIASIVASQLVIGYLMALILGVDTLSQPVWTAVYSALSYLVALLLIIFIPPAIIKKSQKSDRNLLGLKGLPTWSDIGLAPIGFIVYLLIASILTCYLVSFLGLMPNKSRMLVLAPTYLAQSASLRSSF